MVVPVYVIASKLLKIRGHAVSLGSGVRYWAVSPQSGADGFRACLIVTFLFPE